MNPDARKQATHLPWATKQGGPLRDLDVIDTGRRHGIDPSHP